MGFALAFHVLMGSLGLLAGYMAVSVTKGAPLHRRSGVVFVASMLAFFIGQAHVFPEPIRVRPLLALPVPLILAVMAYGLWKLRAGRRLLIAAR